ncbi:unnamed protein product [Calypogeia fissa]
MDAERDEQKAKVLAFLLLSEVEGHRCTPEYLSSACLAFPVTSEEIRRLCKLPNVPLRLLDNERLIEVSKSFHIRVTSLVSLLHNQTCIGTGTAKYVVDSPASRKDDHLFAKPRSILEPIATRSDFDGVNAIQLEPAVTEIRTQVESCIVLLPTGNGVATNGSIESNHNENPSKPPQRKDFHISAVDAANLGNPTQPIEDSRKVSHYGNLCTPLERTEETNIASHQVENPSNVLQRTERTPLAPVDTYLAEQGLLPLLNEIDGQPKKKSRDSRSVPRFEDYAVDGEVGAGGYGTVYKVRRHSDGQVFAMKCPLENTHHSNVRNEINMLKRFRGTDNIIQFQNEVIGKVSPKPEAGGGGGEEVNCPSILLEFIEHDKPEVLKKEITIHELKCYSVCLFKALAQLHKERILHLDVKPGNFLFSRSTNRGCLVDFNLARDESAKRLSTRRPGHGSLRAVTANAHKPCERTKSLKRTSVPEETTTSTRVKPSKRSRQIFQCYSELGTLPASGPCMGDQSKETQGPSKDATVTSSPKLQQLPTGAITASVPEETTTSTRVKPSKRSRQIFQCYSELGTLPASGPCMGDQSKETQRPSKDATVTSSPKLQQLPTGAITASVPEETTTSTRVKPSKRSRQIFQCYSELGTLPASGPCMGDQSKETQRPSKDATVTSSPKLQQLPTGATTASQKHAEPLKVNKSLDNAGNAQQSGTSRSQQPLIRLMHHRCAPSLKENCIRNTGPSMPPLTQVQGVPAVKPNPNKRVSGVPPRPHQSVQPSIAKRVKPGLKVKAPCHQIKEGPCVGTKGYRAPEVLMRSAKQTTKVDIWSAGVSLLQLVTGRSPFPSTSTDGALKDIAKLRGSVAIDNLAKSLSQRHRFSKDHPYPGVSVEEWSEKHSRRTDLKGRIPITLHDLIEKCLDVNPDTRITAEEALLHQFCSSDNMSDFSMHPNNVL